MSPTTPATSMHEGIQRWPTAAILREMLRHLPVKLNGYFARRLARWVQPHIQAVPTTRHPERIAIHPTARIQDAVLNASSGAITIGEWTFFGHGVKVLAARHDYSLRGQARMEGVPDNGSDVTIGKGVWVASGATIVGPCRVGDDAVIAAGSVVTADVPPGEVVAGVPARRVRPREH